MKEKAKWKESKFILKRGKIRASRNHREVSISSRLTTEVTAQFYSRYINQFVKGELLDLGCGKVPLYKAYEPYIDNITCLDWSKSPHENIHLDIISDLNETLPLQNNLFDTVILSDVLEHIRRPENLLKEINRVLKKDGTLILNVPFMYGLHEEPFDYFRYTRHALKAMLEDSNFEIIIFESLGGVPELLADIQSKSVIQIPVLGKFFAWLIQESSYYFLKTIIGKKLSTISSEKLPLSYGLIARKI